jgi:hypothetical protein
MTVFLKKWELGAYETQLNRYQPQLD